MSEKSKSPKFNRPARHAARVAVVQALYQHEQSDFDATEILNQFINYRLNVAPDEKYDINVDKSHFKNVFNSYVQRQEEIDGLIKGHLKKEWQIERLDAVLRAVLRSGCAELLLDERPAAIVINEHVQIAKEFFDGKEPGFINGMLDHIARSLDMDMHTNGKELPVAKIEDPTFEGQTSGADNWEGEGGSCEISKDDA
jgi:N utilization substance protein B